MVSVDEHTRVGIEIISEGSKLTSELILKMLQALNDLFDKKDKDQDFIHTDNTKEGKQSIKDLIKKHSDGVIAFDDNLTKEQVADYQKQFKKMGVDFSIVKNDKDSYSFFFAAKDANIIEKTLKNIVEIKNKEIENQKEIPEEISIQSNENNLLNSLKEFSPQEIELFMKINEIEIANKNNLDSLNELKKGLSNEQISKVETLYKENIFTGNEEIPQNKILSTDLNKIESNLENKENVIEIAEKSLQNKINNLSPKEQELFNKMNELKELKDEIPNEQLMNIQALHNEYSSLTSTSKEEQLNSIFQQLSPEEKDYFLKTNELMMDSNSSEKLFELSEVTENLSGEQINKVDDLYNKNIHVDNDKAPKGKIHMNDVEKVAADLINNNEKNIDNQNQEIANFTVNYPEKAAENTTKITAEKEVFLKDVNIEELTKVDLNTSKEERLNNIFEKLTNDGKNLFYQINESKIEELDNVYGSPADKAFYNLQNNSKNFSENDVNKLSEIYKSNISTAESSKNLQKGEIHMDEVNKLIDKLKNNKAELNNPTKDKQKSPSVFSMSGVKEITKVIKEQETDNKDKNRKQSITR